MMPDEIITAKKDSALKDQTSDSKNEITPKPTYTEEQLKKAVSDALAEVGRKHKAEIEPIKAERDTFKNKVSELQNQYDDTTESLEKTRKEIKELETDFEKLSDDNPDAGELKKLRKEIKAAREQEEQEIKSQKKALKELEDKLKSEREEWAGTVAEAQAAKFEVDVFEISEEYADDTGKPLSTAKLKAACEKAGIKKREDIEGLASIFFTKKDSKPTEETKTEMKTDSGVGGGYTSELTIDKVKKMSPEEIEKRRKEIAKLPLGL
jgi:chromosome segregation ATPase